MTIETEIKTTLDNHLNCTVLRIENESHHHCGNNPESHFKVVIVSSDFENLTMIKRHQKLNHLLKEIYPKIHALSLRTYDLNEWNQLQNTPISPLCASKK